MISATALWYRSLARVERRARAYNADPNERTRQLLLEACRVANYLSVSVPDRRAKEAA